MAQPITLESLYELLSHFISRQEAFNSKQEAFNSKQEAFNSKQEAFNSKQEAFNSKQEAFNSKQEAFNSKQEDINTKLISFVEEQKVFNARLEDRLDRFQEEEKANHNLSHRMIMQSFEGISDIRRDMDDQREPWLAKK